MTPEKLQLIQSLYDLKLALAEAMWWVWGGTGFVAGLAGGVALGSFARRK